MKLSDVKKIADKYDVSIQSIKNESEFYKVVLSNYTTLYIDTSYNDIVFSLNNKKMRLSKNRLDRLLEFYHKLQ